VEDHSGEITEMVPLVTYHLSLLTLCDFPLHRRLASRMILEVKRAGFGGRQMTSKDVPDTFGSPSVTGEAG
jgi:hypothetical protein